MARVLACGAFLKNAACLLDTTAPDTVRWSASHGDLSDPQACAALATSVQQLLAQATVPIDAVAHDLHPDFFSSQLALQLAHEHAVPAIAVQHHHAHIATVLAEHGARHDSTRPVIGIALDGAGLGTDNTIWGGEVLLVAGASFERLGHLSALALPGGDVAAREPWRMAAAALHACGQTAAIVPRFAPQVGEQAASTIATMLQRRLNCPQTTAAGRWFDAAAALLGLSVRQTHEAQAAMAIEQAAAHWLQNYPLSEFDADWSLLADGQIDLRPLFTRWLERLDNTNPHAVGQAAAHFHVALADALAQHSRLAAAHYGVRDVILGGGCFFNRVLTQRLVHQLDNAGLRVFGAQTISCGDAGLALGQAWVAAQTLPETI